MRDYLQIELHNYCGANCACCPNANITPKRCMTQKLFKKLLREIRSDLRIKTIVPFGTSEPFHPKGVNLLWELLHYANSYRPDISFVIVTNAHFLKAAIVNALLMQYTHAIKEFTISWMGFSRLRGDNREQLFEMGRIAEALTDRFYINVIDEIDYSRPPEALQQYMRRSEPHNYLGYANNLKRTVVQSCIWLDQQDLIVLADGSCVPCCLDWQGKAVVGNLNSEPLKIIWDRHSKNCEKGFAICQKCNLVNKMR